MLIIGMVSQKGGVGKSTLARLVARDFAANDWDAYIADLDINQVTAVEWLSRRRANNIEPDVIVQPYRNAAQAIERAKCDLLVLDGKPASSVETRIIAHASHAVFLPTNVSMDDLLPTVRLAHDLVNNKVNKSKIMFVFGKVPDSSLEVREAQDYVSEAGYSFAKQTLKDRTMYRQALNAGKALSECDHKGLRDEAGLLGTEMATFANELYNDK